MAQKRNTRIVVDQLQEDPLLSFWRILLDPFFLFVLSLFFILLGGGHLFNRRDTSLAYRSNGIPTMHLSKKKKKKGIPLAHEGQCINRNSPRCHFADNL